MTLTEIKVAVLLVLLAGLAFSVHLMVAEHDAKLRAQFDAGQAQATAAFNAQSAASEAAWSAQQAKAVADGQQKLVDLAASTAPVGAALDRLQQRYAEARRLQCPVPQVPGLPANGAGAYASPDLSADLPDRLGGALRQLADYATRLRVARDTCQQSWPVNSPR